MPTPLKRAPLDSILVQRGVLSAQEATTWLRQAQEKGQSYAHVLVEQGKLAEEVVAGAQAEQFGLSFQPLTAFRVAPEFLRTVPVEVMRRYAFVLMDADESGVTVAIADPQDLIALDEIERVIGRPLRLVVSTRTAILAALTQTEGNSQILTQIEAEFRPVLVREDEQGEEVLSLERMAQDRSPVMKLMDLILLSAVQKRASDIHLEVSEHMVEVKYRIDGLLYQAMEPLDLKFHAPLISRLKVMSELDIAEHRIPQDGRFNVHLDGRTIDFRVSVLPSAFGEAVVIRILEKDKLSDGRQELRLSQLGFSDEVLIRFRRAASSPYGMVLVTGPTGSGKTTTLYAALNEVKTGEEKLITIEDPVEYQLRGVVQIPVNEKKGLTFARGLRSILRHDPDKILVGEIRDAETAQIAIQSSLTGHLVFTTVHANNAFDVIARFVNMGIEPYNFVASLNCILAQRLLRAICPACKVASPIDEATCRASGLDYASVKDRPTYQGQGCGACHGLGYRGRRAIAEFLELSDEIKEMILAHKPASELQKTARRAGMLTLREAGLEKVWLGETTLREVNRVTMV